MLLILPLIDIINDFSGRIWIFLNNAQTLPNISKLIIDYYVRNLGDLYQSRHWNEEKKKNKKKT